MKSILMSYGIILGKVTRNRDRLEVSNTLLASNLATAEKRFEKELLKIKHLEDHARQLSRELGALEKRPELLEELYQVTLQHDKAWFEFDVASGRLLKSGRDLPQEYLNSLSSNKN